MSDNVDRSWVWLRRGYYGLLAALFVGFGFFWGPNLINFGRLTRMGMPDVIANIQTHGIPAVQAIKRYHTVHGYFPASMEDLAPEFRESKKSEQYWGPSDISSSDTGFEFVYFTSLGRFSHVIEYSLTPEGEHWEVSGGIVSGRVPLPPVTVESSTQSKPTP